MNIFLILTPPQTLNVDSRNGQNLFIFQKSVSFGLKHEKTCSLAQSGLNMSYLK